MSIPSSEFIPLNLCVMTVSDTRTLETDTSGQTLIDSATLAGHQVYQRDIVKDDIYQIRAITSSWIADPHAHVILVTGGTGFSGRDSTPEALLPLFDKEIIGFGETFRAVSFGDIGSSTIQSRSCAGLANATVIFCLPGSTNACTTAWNAIIKDQLDARHRPCNFVAQLKSKNN